MKLFQLILCLIIVQFILLCISDNAYAYLDPGTGSYIVQLIIAALCGGFFAIKMFWKNIVAFFSKLFSKKVKEESDEHNQ